MMSADDDDQPYYQHELADPGMADKDRLLLEALYAMTATRPGVISATSAHGGLQLQGRERDTTLSTDWSAVRVKSIIETRKRENMEFKDIFT